MESQQIENDKKKLVLTPEMAGDRDVVAKYQYEFVRDNVLVTLKGSTAIKITSPNLRSTEEEGAKQPHYFFSVAERGENGQLTYPHKKLLNINKDFVPEEEWIYGR